MLERARDLRAAGELKDALAQMNACAECPALTDVCDQTRASMRDALPTLAVRARACDGTTLDATVTSDGDHKSVSLVIADVPRATPPAVWVLGGSAAGAVITAAALFGVAFSLPDHASLLTPAARDMPLMPVDETKHDFAVAGAIALAVSATVLVTALIVYLTRPFPHPKSSD